MVLGDLDDASHLETMVFGSSHCLLPSTIPTGTWMHLVYGMIQKYRVEDTWFLLTGTCLLVSMVLGSYSLSGKLTVRP
jgi:hypothetical protein